MLSKLKAKTVIQQILKVYGGYIRLEIRKIHLYRLQNNNYLNFEIKVIAIKSLARFKSILSFRI